MRMTMAIFIGAVALAPVPVLSAGPSDHGRHTGHAGHAGHDMSTPYAGQQDRAIKSLSGKDIDDLRNGRGWGLARAAELNGMPGPVHVLELSAEIGLSPSQVTAITGHFNAMKAKAVPLGKTLIEREARLERAFASRDIDGPKLKALLSDIAAARSELRFVHLAAHLETPAILSPAQIKAYNKLRGY